MNARFRIGRTYRFTSIGQNYIANDDLIYLGFDKILKVYKFSFKSDNMFGQVCNREWINTRKVTYKEIR